MPPPACFTPTAQRQTGAVARERGGTGAILSSKRCASKRKREREREREREGERERECVAVSAVARTASKAPRPRGPRGLALPSNPKEGRRERAGSKQAPNFVTIPAGRHDAAPALPRPHPPVENLPAAIPQYVHCKELRRGRPHPLRAQEILQKVMPFIEQELATSPNEAHANLAQWTTALWGHSIQLLDSPENERPGSHLTGVAFAAVNATPC